MDMLIALIAIPVVFISIRLIYVISIRYMNRPPRLEPPKQEEREKTNSPPAKRFVVENNLFYNRDLDSCSYSESDIQLLLRNTKDRLPISRNYPFQENTTIRMSSFQYDEKTHYARMEFRLETTYQTVDRYVQRNYVRTPIYSAPKTKYKTVKKSLRVRADELESLAFPCDRILEIFNEEIIVKLNSVDFVPSWAIREWTFREENEYLKYLKEQVKKTEESSFAAERTRDNTSPALKSKTDQLKAKIEKLTAKYQKKKGKRKDKLAVKIAGLSESVVKNETRLEEMQNAVSQAKKAEEDAREKEKRIKENIRTLCQKLDKSVPVLSDLEEHDGFIPLTKFSLKPYEKIMGVYVIRNNKNNRVYVGQSKDVMRRIKQHFRGTVPANVIFAEDYYSTPAQEREYLFSVRIDELYSKDELDSVEKEMIEAYDAYTKGYNGTKGNN